MPIVSFVFEPSAQPVAKVLGGGDFPVRRIFCIGKNYADHVREMGGDPKSDPPVFFTKPADAVVGTGTIVSYPQGTSNLHYEGELVIALKAGGRDLKTREEAGALIFGQAAGCDLTRRDLQGAAKKAGGPWDAAKGFDNSAPLGLIARIEDFPPDLFDDARLILKVNGVEKQNASLRDMIWTVPEIIIALSGLFELKAGDLIFTGTPDGVGPLSREDQVEVTIGVLPPLEFAIG
ncbi:MAG: fumarylacetoacetate hydrolase family protein [Parvularculaceae bacterium]|nr:fumarylacetoacetate hydrolase family protein [Parvularculaceae bacterium]